MPAIGVLDLPAASLARLAARLRALDYTVDAVIEAIGMSAHRALGRNATAPAFRALVGRDDPLATLTRLWLLQRTVPATDAERALGPVLNALVGADVLARSGDGVVAVSDLRPYASDDGASGWVFADLTPGLDGRTAPMRPDYVLGVSSASSTLAQLVPREPVGTALDLGTGCGVQSLHLARHAERVVATDVNPRALAMARLTARLNGVDLEVRAGSLYAPVGGERFDLIVTNPPYVMSPPRPPGEGGALTYREGAFVGDELVRRVVVEGAAHLNPGGRLQVLANWAHVVGEDWTERIAGWVEPTGCDAYVLQRETLDAAEYVELWLADAGLVGTPGYLTAYDGWLDYFAGLGIEAVGMGWLSLRAAGRDRAYVDLVDWPWAVEQPLGPAFAARDDALDEVLPLTDAEVLGRRWALASDVVQETIGDPGATDPQHVVLRQQRGFRHAEPVDTAIGGVLGACDGELALGTIVDAVAQITGVGPADLVPDTLFTVRRLAIRRLLTCVE
ncbi:MAG: DUF7059 domain-containing protein [Propionibacteriaceae bacterium]